MRAFFRKNQNRSRLQKRWLAAANFKWITTEHFCNSHRIAWECCAYMGHCIGTMYRITCTPTFQRIYMSGIQKVFGHCFYFLWSTKSKGSPAKLTILFTELFKHALNVRLFTSFFSLRKTFRSICCWKKIKIIRITYPNIPDIFAFRINCRWSQTIDFHPTW